MADFRSPETIGFVTEKFKGNSGNGNQLIFLHTEYAGGFQNFCKRCYSAVGGRQHDNYYSSKTGIGDQTFPS